MTEAQLQSIEAKIHDSQRRRTEDAIAEDLIGREADCQVLIAEAGSMVARSSHVAMEVKMNAGPNAVRL